MAFTFRSMGVVCLAFAGVASAGMSAIAAPVGLSAVTADTRLLNTEAWVMGGSGTTIPSQSYIDAVMERFVDPSTPLFTGQPTFPVNSSNGLVTPEGLYPIVGVKSLPLDTSVSQGEMILYQTIENQIAAGNNMVVLGFSQSTVISSLVMRYMMTLPTAEQPTADQLSFVLLGNVSNPNGGFLSRFDVPGAFLMLPSLGITFSGATPADAPWQTAVYTTEYDGYADFPKYPINLLSDINAVMGTMSVHGAYPGLTAQQMATAIELPVSSGYSGNTEYFMIPTQLLPILQPLLGIPVIGQPLYDLLEPDMRILVNLGYGNLTHGWDQGPADVATPFGVLPDVSLGDLVNALVQGAEQGIGAFAGDLSHVSLSAAAEQMGAALSNGLPSFAELVDVFTAVTSTAYSTLLPTADIINALITTLPAYDLELFVDGLSRLDLVDALGMPVAASVGLSTMLAGVEYQALSGAAATIAQDLSYIFGS